MITLRAWMIPTAGCIALASYGWWQHHRASQWRDQAHIEAANHQQTKAAYVAAQAEATAKAKAAREKTETRYAELAKEAHDANEKADNWRARVQRFADGGGMRQQGGACVAGTTGNARASSDADLAASSDGPGAVTLTRADFDTLTANTERLLRVHAWGQALISEGLAQSAAPEN